MPYPSASRLRISALILLVFSLTATPLRGQTPDAPVSTVDARRATAGTDGAVESGPPQAPAPPVVMPPRPAGRALVPGTTEWMALVGSAWGVELFHSSTGHDYLTQTVGWGRVLTAPHGPGLLRGQFEWAMEATPMFLQYEPRGVYGVGFSPIVWRWNFMPHGRMAPYFEIAGGGLWTSAPVPERTTTSNWTAHGGFGLRIFVADHQGLVIGYRLHHISNGNRLELNPGVNGHTVYAGWTLLR